MALIILLLLEYWGCLAGKPPSFWSWRHWVGLLLWRGSDAGSHTAASGISLQTWCNFPIFLSPERGFRAPGGGMQGAAPPLCQPLLLPPVLLRTTQLQCFCLETIWSGWNGGHPELLGAAVAAGLLLARAEKALTYLH